MQAVAYGGSKEFPFHKMIAQSQILEGGITGNFTRNAMKRAVEYVGCNTTSLDSDRTIHCLRDLSMEKLVDGQNQTATSSNIGDEWLPVVDGEVSFWVPIHAIGLI